MIFNSRRTYLTAVKEWQQLHSEQINMIRKNKLALKDAQRQRNMGGIWAATFAIVECNEVVAEMILERQAGRVEAARQYKSSREAQQTGTVLT